MPERHIWEARYIQRVWRTLNELGRIAEIAFGDQLESIVVHGSLVHSGFVPGFSDIDYLAVFADGTLNEDVHGELRRLIGGIRESYPDIGDALHADSAAELSALGQYDLDDDATVYPRDIADIMLYGITVAGRDIRDDILMPVGDQLREASIYFLYWIPDDPPGLKALVNCIFWVGGTLYLVERERMTYAKAQLAALYTEARLPHWDLIARAAEIRRDWPVEIDCEGQAQLTESYAKFRHEAIVRVEAKDLHVFHALYTQTPGIVWAGPPPAQQKEDEK
jgi:hypothetical protein